MLNLPFSSISFSLLKEMDFGNTQEPQSHPKENKLNQRLLGVITILLIMGALKVSSSVSLPLAFGLFLVAVFWPVYTNLEKKLPVSMAVVATLFLFLAIILLFVLSLWYSGEMIADAWPKYSSQFGQYQQQVESSFKALGINLSAEENSDSAKKAFFKLSQSSYTGLPCIILNYFGYRLFCFGFAGGSRIQK